MMPGHIETSIMTVTFWSTVAVHSRLSPQPLKLLISC